MTKILEFPKPYVIPPPDLIGGSHQIAVIAEIPSLRGFEKAEAISRNSKF